MDAVVASASSPSKVLSPPTPQLAATRISPRKLNESIEKETTDLLIQNRPKRIKMMNDDDNVDVSAKSSTASLFKVDTSDMNEYNQLKRHGLLFNFECEMETINVKHLQDQCDHTVLCPHNDDNDAANATTTTTKVTLKDWQENKYLQLPCYDEFNVDENGRSVWPEIIKSLNHMCEAFDEDGDSIHIEFSIKKYHPKFKNRLYFQHLHEVFDEIVRGRGEKNLKKLLRNMVKLALDLPNKFPRPIPILKENTTHSVSMTQEQCACLLANSFFCTFSTRLFKHNPTNVPYANFNEIFGDTSNKFHSKSSVKREKIKCLLHYFQRVTTNMPKGVITFSRYSFDPNQMISFENSTEKLRKIVIKQEGTIEDCFGALQMDFANKYLGGGVLNTGCVQEEIRFMICPELIVSTLITERLNDHECAQIKGCERFSNYKGYASSFKWSGNYADKTPRDNWQRMFTHLLVVDALYFGRRSHQFRAEQMRRELDKCFVGFCRKFNDEQANLPAIATGNWGCGAFNGDKQLKFLIQAITAAVSDRDLVYYTFNDEDTTHDLNALLEIIQQNNLNVSHIYQLLHDYSNYFQEALAKLKMSRAKKKAVRKNRSRSESNGSEKSGDSSPSSSKQSDASPSSNKTTNNNVDEEERILSILDFFRSKF